MKNNLADKIINKIKERQIGMRPRWHFILQTLLVILVCVLAFILAVWLLSWLYFILHASGAWFLPAFGRRGWLSFLNSFPWWPATIGLILVMILAFVLEKFRWAYRQPLLYIGLASLGVVILFSWTVAQTPLHRGFYREAYQKDGDLAGSLYRGYGRMPAGPAYVGTVINAATSTFEITTEDGQVIFVATTPGTRLPFGYNLAPNDTVMVMGERSDNMLTAWGVREINDNDGFYAHPRMMRRMMPGGPPPWGR